MKASELFDRSPLSIEYSNLKDVEITGMSYDSRKIEQGNIFFAIKGIKEDGNKYIKSAVRNGAVLIITEEDLKSEDGTQFIKVKNIRKLMASLSRIYYTDGLSNLKLIGITGTNGKTTTSYLIKYLLESAGFKTGLIGTIDYQIGNTSFNSVLTTPDSIELNILLGKMEKREMNFCVMEVSSVALEMDRTYGLNFDSAVFTNLTSEHLDYHKNMENYFQAKKILFDGLKESSYAVSNKDDKYGEKILADTNSRKFFYSIRNESDLRACNEKISLYGTEFEINYGNKNYKFNTSLSGRFNIYNILASISTVINYNIDIEHIHSVLAGFNEVSGRFNKVKLNNGAVAVIDYSHTSDSLKNAILAAREIVSNENRNGRVITIFGCGGDKDKTKRPVMGKYAANLSDYTIITSDNPRSEDPFKIIEEIVSGIVKEKNNYEVIEDREKAIKRGIEISSGGDIVLICGKGHENYQEIKGIKNHFDDKEIIDKYLKTAE